MIILAINHFYIIVTIVVLGCLINILYTLLIKPLLYKNKTIKLLNKASGETNINYSLIKNKQDGCTFSLKIKEKIYNVKVLQTPKNCDLQINNIETFVVYKKANADAMKSKVLNDMHSFMNSKLENKIIIIPKKAKTIKKVINECEMIMVNHSVDVYKTHLYNSNEVIHLFK